MTNQYSRLETILKMLLHQKTGSLEPPAQTFNDRVENYAYHLLDSGVIVMVGELLPTQRSQLSMHLQFMMHTYTELYYLLNTGLYNSTDVPVAYLADKDYPLVVVFEAKMYIIVRVLANLIIPYVALRHHEGRSSLIEKRGIIETMLEQLGADKVEPERKQIVRQYALQFLDSLLEADIKQVSLTNFSQDVELDFGHTRKLARQTVRPNTIPGLETQPPAQTPTKPEASPDNIIPLPPLRRRERDEDSVKTNRGLLGRLRGG